MGNMDYDPLLASVKMTHRHRWTPTAMQLQILEHVFIQGNGTPTKQRIKEITSELTSHGQVSEANVYNWFQNRRARLKRKQLHPASATSEKETEPEVESPKEKNDFSVNFLLQDNLEQMDGITQLHNTETSAEIGKTLLANFTFGCGLTCCDESSSFAL